jgi:C4-dicarboxylate-specific signal transduction histidine kinase
MARPLREQFVLAALVLLVPVGVIMALLAARAYRAEVSQLEGDARAAATTVAGHIEAAGLAADGSLAAFLRRMPLPEGGQITVFDAEGNELARRDPEQLADTEMFWRQTAIRGGRGSVQVGLPTELAWLRARGTYQWTILVSGLATLILLGLQALFLRRWLPSLRQLERDADRVGAGNLTRLAPERMPARELEHVRGAFAGMVENLRVAREAIAGQVGIERRMREELQLLQQQVIRQERLAAIGVLLSGIAHELNNPLQSISGFSDLLQRDPTVHEGVRADLALIQKESARASAIIRNLARFSRQQGAPPAVVLLSEVVSSVVELRQRRLHEQSIRLEVEESASRPTRAIFAELQQVLLNFIINAEQAIIGSATPDRRLTIRTLDAGPRLRVEVEDTGPGVPADDEAKLFQPFFTTKPVGEGTGLGLSVSYGIIRSLKGTIGYQRATSGGACFYFELPALEEAPDR